MSWRERLRRNPSNAEIQVYEELQRQKMYEYERDWVLVIDDFQGVMAFRKEQVTFSVIKNRKFGLPDFLAEKKRKPVYLDGEKVHGTPTRSRKDAVFRTALTVNGWEPLLIVYNGRELPAYKLKLIVDEMRLFLDGVVEEIKEART